MNISELKAGDRVTVTRCQGDGSECLRLQEMGLLPGASLEIMRFASVRGPIEVKVRGTRLSLRLEEASLVEVKR